MEYRHDRDSVGKCTHLVEVNFLIIIRGNTEKMAFLIDCLRTFFLSCVYEMDTNLNGIKNQE